MCILCLYSQISCTEYYRVDLNTKIAKVNIVHFSLGNCNKISQIIVFILFQSISENVKEFNMYILCLHRIRVPQKIQAIWIPEYQNCIGVFLYFIESFFLILLEHFRNCEKIWSVYFIVCIVRIRAHQQIQQIWIIELPKLI